jgi:hypothetical protein
MSTYHVVTEMHVGNIWGGGEGSQYVYVRDFVLLKRDVWIGLH